MKLARCTCLGHLLGKGALLSHRIDDLLVLDSVNGEGRENDKPKDRERSDRHGEGGETEPRLHRGTGVAVWSARGGTGACLHSSAR